MKNQKQNDQKANKEELLRKQCEEIYHGINEEKIIIENIGQILESVSNTNVKKIVFEQAASTFQTVFLSNIRLMDNIFNSPEPPAWLEPLINDERWHDVILKLAPDNQDSMFLKYILREIYQRFPQKIHSLPCGCTPLSDFLKILPAFSDPVKQGLPSSLEKFIDLMKSDSAILTAAASAIHKSMNIPFILRVWEQLGRQNNTKESKLFITYILRVENCTSSLIKYILNDVHTDNERLDFIKQCKINFSPERSNYNDETSPSLSYLLSLPENTNKKLTKYFILQKIPNFTFFNAEIAKTIYVNSLKPGEEPNPDVLKAINIVIVPKFKDVFENDKHINRYYLFKLLKERFFAVASLNRIESISSTNDQHNIGFYESLVQILFEINYWNQDLRLKIVNIIKQFLQRSGKDAIYYKKFTGIAFFLMVTGYPIEVLRAITSIGKGDNPIEVRQFFIRVVNSYKPPYSIPFLEEFLISLSAPNIYPMIFPTNPKAPIKDQQKSLMVALRSLFEQIINLQREELEDIQRHRINQPNPLSAMNDLIRTINDCLSRPK